MDPEHSESSLVLGEGPRTLLLISQILSLNLGPLGKTGFWKKSPHSPLVTGRTTSLDLRSQDSILVLDERFMAIAQSEFLDLAPLTLAHTGSVSQESGSAHQEVARAPRLPLPMLLQNLCTTGPYNPQWAHGYMGGSHKARIHLQPPCFSYSHVSNIFWVLIQLVLQLRESVELCRDQRGSYGGICFKEHNRDPR